MVSRCKQQGINFWPIALEKDGCPTSSFLAFLKNVCDTAGKYTDQNTSSFRKYWFARLACKFNHHIASLDLRRSIAFRRTLQRCQPTDFNLKHRTSPNESTNQSIILLLFLHLPPFLPFLLFLLGYAVGATV
jgi:hypothetical protein